MSIAAALREIAAILNREAAALEQIMPHPTPAADPAPEPAPAWAPNANGYPTYPVAVLSADTPDKGVNHYCVVGPVKITVPVILPGLVRIDTVAAADSPARGGTFFNLTLKDANGTPVLWQRVAQGATIVFGNLSGSYTLDFWTDEPATAWVVYR